MLLIREPTGPLGEQIRGGGNALLVSEKGDAKLLEIGATASTTNTGSQRAAQISNLT
jgi:hypothetical protein